MKKIIAANWKMNPETAKEGEEIVEFLAENYTPKDVKVILFPPFVYFCHLRDELGDKADMFEWGAQDIFWAEHGAYTGEISPTMLKSLWVEYVIIGHSERRWKLGETDEMINKKMKAALDSNIIPILAVGEREKADSEQEVLGNQLKLALEGIEKDKVSKVIIAYEPVWAISTSENAVADTPDNATEAIGIIREKLTELYDEGTMKSIPILYGGSVDEENVASFLEKEGIDGALVGGASIRKEEFLKILNVVEEL